MEEEDKPIQVVEEALAFPGAEGFGKDATGGRGGKVIYVDNLNDAGPGSFRAAVETAGPRYILFKVSGNIELKSRLDIRFGDVTIYEKVLAFGGASLKRDPLDERVIETTRNGTYSFPGSDGSAHGIIDSQGDVGGWPELNSAEPPLDSSGDGMPDEWKIANKLDPEKSQANGKDLSTAYDNVEVYINSLVEHIVEGQK